MKRILGTIALTCVLFVPALAGEIPTCGCKAMMGEVPIVGSTPVPVEIPGRDYSTETNDIKSSLLTSVFLTLVGFMIP